MIICCGKSLIDMLPRKLEDGSDVFLPVSGGAIFNTAIALGRLGLETGFVSGISTDMFGEQLLASLEKSKVSTRYCIRSDWPSTLAFVKLTDGHAKYYFFDENSATRMIEETALPQLPSSVSALHFGAISLIPEPGGSTCEALMKREASNAVISLDPNIRPGFVKDETAYRARLKRMIAISDIVKVSDEDLAWLEPEKDVRQSISELLGAGVAIVLLTKGGEGVTAFTDSYKLDVAAQKVTVVDTIGAGDTFNAGFLAGLERIGQLDKPSLKTISQDDLRSAVELANKVAAVTVSRAGANPPWLDELDA